MKLKNKKCFITGASSGIGLEITKRLLNDGVYVYSVSLDPMPIEHENLNTYQCNLSDIDAVKKAFKKGVDVLTSIDIYIANAGQARYGYSKDLSESDARLMLELNMYAVIQGLHLMKTTYEDQAFTFVATSSVMAFWPLPGYAYYSATKAAISTYIKDYRNEVSKNQKLILIYPVATDTNFFKVSGQKHSSWMIQSPEHVATKTIKGIKKGRKNIYTSILFMFVYSFFPFLLKPYVNYEINKLKQKND